MYQALWAKNDDFDEILISPVMIQDHMPDKVMSALEKLLVNVGPPKPKRKSDAQVNNNDLLELPLLRTQSPAVTPSSFDRTPSRRVMLETSFADTPPMANDDTDSIKKVKTLKPGLQEALRHSSRFDLLVKGKAPLASPETLSDSSSVQSKLVVKDCVSVAPKVSPISSVKSSTGSPVQSTSAGFHPIKTSTIDSMKLTTDSLSERAVSEASTRPIGDTSSMARSSMANERESQVSLQDLIEQFSGRSSSCNESVSTSAVESVHGPGGDGLSHFNINEAIKELNSVTQAHHSELDVSNLMMSREDTCSESSG